MVAMTLPAGHVADTQERKRVIIITQAALAFTSIRTGTNASTLARVSPNSSFPPGRVAVEGVEAGAFFIFTHAHAIDLAESRFRDQRAGSERRWPPGTVREAPPDSFDPNA